MAERTLEHLLRPRSAGVGLDAFAVEPNRAQLVWSRPGAGTLRVELDGRPVELPTALDAAQHAAPTGRPGAIELDDLRPDTRYRAQLLRDGEPIARHTFRTPSAPGGERLFRFATISDLHLGRGDRVYRTPHLRKEVPEPRNGPGLALAELESDRQFRAARAAIAEALDWGAELLVVKGDLCDESVDWIWDQAAELLGSLPVPVVILPGNHDTGLLRVIEPEVGAAERGLDLVRGVDHLDVPGLRIVLVDSTNPGNGWGSLDRHADEVATLAAEAAGREPRGVFVATHHHPQRFRTPLFWPHGVPGPDANRFARTVAAAHPAVLASSGHTHRCRRREVGGVTWTEVAATNHFPGVWAGYTIHDGGITQAVRRIAEPEPMEWIEGTRDVLGGVWALWSAGTLSDRCCTVRW